MIGSGETVKSAPKGKAKSLRQKGPGHDDASQSAPCRTPKVQPAIAGNHPAINA